MLIVFYNFDTHQAAPLNHAILFVCAIVSFCINYFKKHPLRDAPVIDFNISILLTPQFLFGTTLGVILNKVFPQWIILVVLTIILIINTYKVWSKGAQFWRQENVKLINKQLSESLINKETNSEVLIEQAQNTEQSQELKAIIEQEKSRFPFYQNLALIFVLLIVIASALLKGGSKIESPIGVQQCGFWY